MNDQNSPAAGAKAEQGGPSGEDPSSSPSGTNGTDGGPSTESPEWKPGWLQRLFARRRNASLSIRDDLSDALQKTGVGNGEFTPEEKAMLHNILRLQDVRVEDLMIPRADIEAVDLDTTLAELLVIFEKSGHSRMPVYAETLDDPRGMVHIRDLVGYITRAASESRRKRREDAPPPGLDLKRVDLSRPLGKLNLIRNVLFVPPSMLAADLMARMQATRIQMALVIDEYGGTEGLVSLEDIVELVVGDIEDEHDDEEDLIRRTEDGRLICDAKAEIDDVGEALGGNFDVGDHAEDADSVGGVLVSLIGRVPVKGEVIEAFGYEFRIRDADLRRIKSVEILPSGKKAANRKKPQA